MLNEDNLSSEERIRRVVRAARLEMPPAYLEMLRNLSPAVKLAVANSLSVVTCVALYHGELRRGHSATASIRIAKQLMVNLPTY